MKRLPPLFLELIGPTLISAVLALSLVAALFFFVPQKYLDRGFQQTTSFVSELLPGSLHDIQKFADEHPNIGAINLVGLNFQANLRVPIYLYASPRYPVIVESLKKYGQIPSQKIFSQDKKNNEEFGRLIQGQVVCSNADDSPFSKFYHLQEITETVCRFPVGGQHEKVVGFIAYHMIEKPDALELRLLERDTLALAKTVYENEFSDVRLRLPPIKIT